MAAGVSGHYGTVMAVGVSGHYGTVMADVGIGHYERLCAEFSIRFSIGKLKNSTIRAKPGFIRPKASIIPSFHHCAAKKQGPVAKCTNLSFRGSLRPRNPYFSREKA